MVILQTFAVGKLDVLIVHLGKLNFLSVINFALGNVPQRKFYRLELGYVKGTSQPSARSSFPLTGLNQA